MAAAASHLTPAQSAERIERFDPILLGSGGQQVRSVVLIVLGLAVGVLLITYIPWLTTMFAALVRKVSCFEWNLDRVTPRSARHIGARGVLPRLGAAVILDRLLRSKDAK
jgi:hypothetical protein